jgi:hypothetical protein
MDIVKDEVILTLGTDCNMVAIGLPPSSNTI